MKTSKIREIVRHIERGISTIRKTRDRVMMREAILRIRQLRGILENRRV